MKNEYLNLIYIKEKKIIMANSRVYFMNNSNELIRRVDDNLVYFEGPIDEPLVDIYYGASSKTPETNPSLTEDDVKQFTKLTGKIGSMPAPREYTLNNTFGVQYQYWAIPDLPYNDGTRVVNLLIKNSIISFLWAEQPVRKQQLTPDTIAQVKIEGGTEVRQDIYYFLMNINGVSYRLYRTDSTFVSGVVQMYSIS